MTVAKNIGIALAASALMFSGVAQAATRSAAAMPSTTSAQNVELVRSAAPTSDESEIIGGLGFGLVLGILAAVAFISGIVIAAGGNDSPG